MLMDLSEMKEMCLAVQKWLNERYEKMEVKKIWEATCKQYNHYLKELLDYGGKNCTCVSYLWEYHYFFSLSIITRSTTS